MTPATLCARTTLKPKAHPRATTDAAHDERVQPEDRRAAVPRALNGQTFDAVESGCDVTGHGADSGDAINGSGGGAQVSHVGEYPVPKVADGTREMTGSGPMLTRRAL